MRHLRPLPSMMLFDDPMHYQNQTEALLKAVHPGALALRPISVECARVMARGADRQDLSEAFRVECVELLEKHMNELREPLWELVSVE